MAEYDKETFEPTEPQEPVEPTEPQEPVNLQEPTEPVSPEPTEPQEPVEPVEPAEPEPVDNWETRARYQQSEADKFKNIAEQQRAQFQQIIDTQKPKEVKNEMPQRPDSDDPTDLIDYNIKLSEYTLNKMNKREETDQAKQQQADDLRQQAGARDWALGEMTKVTKNPDKSQRILGFFADANNLKDPALYNVMYDAAMELRNHKSPGKPNPKAPLPPLDGGEEPETDEKTPDDEFNEQLGQNDRYKL